jgi:hypothetical protein
VEATASGTPFGIDTLMRWERSSTQTRTEYGKLTGFTEREDRSLRPNNTMKWTVHENQLSLRGIPKLLLVALLLKRAKRYLLNDFLPGFESTDVSGPF